MANRKISDLTALTAPVTGDLLPIVDISEAAAADKNKKITYGTFLSNVPLGTAAAPSVAFTGDSNTGIYSPGADQLAVATNGTGRLFVDATGNVAIAQAPSNAASFTKSFNISALDASIALRGSSGGAYTNQGIFFAVDATNYAQIYNEAAGQLIFRTGSGLSERLRITSAGNVGIGTSSPATTLDVNGDVTITDKIIHGGDTNTAIRFPAADTVSVETAGSERARIDSSGRLLVGTSAVIGDAFAGSTGVRLLIASGTTASIGTHRNDNTAFSNAFIFTKARGTATEAVTADDTLGIVAFQGANGSAFNNAAEIRGEVDGVVSGGGANDMPGRIRFLTTADGAASPTERMRITSAGVLQIAEAGNITVGTTTGTKIGTATTQKIGFYNATPVVQPAAVANATTAVDVITQLNDLLAKLRTLGIIAA